VGAKSTFEKVEQNLILGNAHLQGHLAVCRLEKVEQKSGSTFLKNNVYK